MWDLIKMILMFALLMLALGLLGVVNTADLKTHGLKYVLITIWEGPNGSVPPAQ